MKRPVPSFQIRSQVRGSLPELDKPAAGRRQNGLVYQTRQQVITALTEDQPEAAAAFLEKRAPHYKHR